MNQKNSVSFDEIEKARKILELPEKASMSTIKDAYRNLSLKYHPDANQSINDDKMKELNWAYDIILKYCEIYEYSFLREDFTDNFKNIDNIDSYWKKHFGNFWPNQV